MTEEQRRLSLRKKIQLKKNQELFAPKPIIRKIDEPYNAKFTTATPILKLLLTVFLFYYNYNIFRSIFLKFF